MLWVAKPAAGKEARMGLHRNARSCSASRAVPVERVAKLGWTVRAAAESLGMRERRACVWPARFRTEGEVGPQDRSSRPRRWPDDGFPQPSRSAGSIASTTRGPAGVSALLPR
ncbi:MAG: hypothetical protein EPN53_16850 [Acidobacteria bacterium]|nr:MAG: hypothetical protein EPN53_16850 [Acidobacteriota bacterium]